jgi:hypothetical protein
MKKGLLTIILILIVSRVFAPCGSTLFIPETDGINPYLQVWQAVKLVETGTHPDTINYQEGAYGPGQIRQAKLDDFNQDNGTSFTLEDCLAEGLSRRIFCWHCMKFNDIDLAIRRWNGSGSATYEYLKKVKELLTQNK